MAQPRKYSTDADRFRAYRERKKAATEKLAREVTELRGNRMATHRRELLTLRREVGRGRKLQRVNDLVRLLDHIALKLDKLLEVSA